MTYEKFEDTMRSAIAQAYIKVMGVEKWNSLTDSEKEMAAHLMVQGFGKVMGIEA